jgi:hypothetical protein
MSVELDPKHFEMTGEGSPRYIGPAEKLVILFYRPGCGHCESYHPSYKEAAKRGSKGVLFTECDTSNEEKYGGLLEVIRGPLSPFSFQGVPTVVCYYGQSYYSTYGPSDNTSYRTPEDTINYANGIGTSDITYV